MAGRLRIGDGSMALKVPGIHSVIELEDRFTLPVYSNIRLPLTIVRGKGSYVYDDGGVEYLDLYGGHAVSIIGHSHPVWVEDMCRQIETLTFYSNAVYNPVRAEAARLLVEHSYPSMRSVFFCNSGAEANETALKIARKATGRRFIVSMKRGFHGRTIGALSATGFPAMRQRFPENIDDWSRFFDLGAPDIFSMKDSDQVAAVIVEPIQSVAGVYMAEPEYYRRLREYTRRNGICLIFDEVQTGSGRTGEWYAGTHWGVEPDIVTTAKGVGGGMPVGVVIVNEEVAEKVEPGDQATTFGGSPLAAAAVGSTYRIIENENLIQEVRDRSAALLPRLRAIPGVHEVRGMGYLLGIESELPAKELAGQLMKERILVGTCSQADTIRLLPPLTVSAEEWERFLEVFDRLVRSS